MAQKAAKQLAARNAAILARLHTLSLAVNALYLLLRFALFRRSATRSSLLLFVALNAPALAVELWFETQGRPRYAANGDLQRAGDDLEAKGLTDYMTDVLYWTWITMGVAAVVGDRGWYLWGVIPIYSVWLAWSTFGSVKKGIMGMAGQDVDGNGQQGGAATSNRQKKLEKRGGQKVQYR